jgi:hypothetical protein
LKAGLEPEKLHPKDWANPGRVRVLLKDENGKLMNSKIKNSKLQDKSSTGLRSRTASGFGPFVLFFNS